VIKPLANGSDVARSFSLALPHCLLYSWANAVTDTPQIKADMKKVIESVPS
jgi:hypothetical protein